MRNFLSHPSQRPLFARVRPFVRPFQPFPEKYPHLEKSLPLGPVWAQAAENLETIRQKAKDARLSQNEYVIRCCLGRQIVVIDSLKEVLQQQRVIGNNLNRLTVLANMGRITTADLDRTAQELAEISSTLRGIQERERRFG